MSNQLGNTTSSGIAYVQDRIEGKTSSLYTLDLSTGKVTKVGEIGFEVSDLVFVENRLYGIAGKKESPTSKLIEVDRKIGQGKLIGDVGFIVVGLSYNLVNKTLYGTNAKELIAINTQTGRGQSALTVADQEYNCGEVAFDSHGKTYITLIGSDRKKLLATCNLNSQEKPKIIGDIGYPNLASMKFLGDTLYGVTGSFFNLGKDGQILKINTQTGAATLIGITDPVSRWAGMSIYQEISDKIPVDPQPISPGQPGISVPITNITFDSFTRDPKLDIVCLTPVRSIVRREEEITIIRKVRKVEDVDASPACPVNTTEVSK
ncbi:hypothetical protein M595_0582 [Lyngbya aestuarii BL J]|uniref:SMP-30/Gluconolaconase/LRE-like region family protein n=1 Tax=Lyngbya aestuarii BL J TaxID=1348334 RepID=U7QQN1_9CYAN|nr:hypothetical protein [Lyngbya aestuarii]ERT09385.1 hypothetical protein M595_0582 [Lyngbya aestuarii BL J]